MGVENSTQEISKSRSLAANRHKIVPLSCCQVLCVMEPGAFRISRGGNSRLEEVGFDIKMFSKSAKQVLKRMLVKIGAFKISRAGNSRLEDLCRCSHPTRLATRLK